MSVGRAGAAFVALVALASGCAPTLGGTSEEAGEAPIVVDEAAPRYGNVGLGSTIAQVERLLGPGDASPGFAPAGRSPAAVAVPLSVPNPPWADRSRPALRRYEDSAFLFLRDRAYAMMLTGPHIGTARGVAIGDSIDEVRRRYDGVECTDVAGGESPSGGVETYPSCRVRVAATRFVFFGGDPIRSVTFYSRERFD
jgi:hypothetical protein